MTTKDIEIKYKWVVHEDATKEWRQMFLRLKRKTAEKKIGLVMDIPALHNLILAPPVRPVALAPLIANATQIQTNLWLTRDKVFNAQDATWKTWQKEQTTLSDQCSMATAILLEMFDDDSLIVSMSEDEQAVVANYPPAVTHWIYLWGKLSELFTPKKAVDRWRIHEEWKTMDDRLVSFPEFKMRWDRYLHNLEELGILPTSSDQEIVLSKAIANPPIREFLMQVLIESSSDPLPVPRKFDLEWFWKQSMGLVAVSDAARDWYLGQKAMWSEVQEPRVDNKRKNPFVSKYPKEQTGAKPGAVAGGNSGFKSGGNSGVQSKYGPKNKIPRKNDGSYLPDYSTKECWRCGRRGHINLDSQGNRSCTEKSCANCNATLQSGQSHNARNCGSKTSVKGFSGRGANSGAKS